MATHPTRTCDVCDQTDDHPRHEMVVNMITGEGASRHMDCCASSGCNVCAKQIAGADGLKGQQLRDHIVGRA
jgi:hypothetical protein